MSEDGLLIKLPFPDMLLHISPFIEGDPDITGGFQEVNLSRVRLKLQNHSHMIKMRVRVASRNLGRSLIAPK